MSKKITIVMPYLNEKNEPIETIRSIYNTASSELFQIVAIDDASSSPPLDFGQFKDVEYIRNKERIGVDGSRHLGVSLSRTPYICVIDSHMRFKKDRWLEKMLKSVEEESNTVWCTTCLGMGYGTNDLSRVTNKYYAATMLFVNKDTSPSKPSRECLEPKWQNQQQGITYEIPCVLGANYFFTKKWYNHIKGLEGLKMWGTSEPFLSLKSYMAGGQCKIRTDVEIGHIFRSNAPYVTKISSLVYNKLFLCKTILPDDLGNRLIGCLPKDQSFNEATKMIDSNKAQIESDKKYYQQIFKRSIYDYCKRFSIELPK